MFCIQSQQNSYGIEYIVFDTNTHPDDQTINVVLKFSVIKAGLPNVGQANPYPILQFTLSNSSLIHKGAKLTSAASAYALPLFWPNPKSSRQKGLAPCLEQI